MGKVSVAGFTVSIDGFGAGPDQSLEDPLGKGGKALHGWFYPTQTFQSMFGKAGETEGADARFASASAKGCGAVILGRNMFGPIRGEWPDEAWKGWWGDNPPYHAPTYILTHHARAPIVMEGGTTFYFEPRQSFKGCLAFKLRTKLNARCSRISRHSPLA